MTIIDLLNKIANGEKLPEKIKFKGDTYYLCEGDLSGNYYFSEKQGFGGVKLKFDTSVMNEEVEIIEGNEIEKLKIVKNGSVNSYALLDENGNRCALTKHSKIMCDKINEIIDNLNKEE